MHNCKELSIWHKAKEFVKVAYEATRKFPKEETFCLTSQIRRAAISIPANIAEGSAKSSDKDFSRFLEISLGSLFEIETELSIAYDLGYFNTEFYNELCKKSDELDRMIRSFLFVLNQKNANAKKS